MSDAGASPLMRVLRILLMEDNPGDARLTQLLLEEATDFPFELVHVTSFEQGMSAIAGGGFDIALVDLSLGDSHGIDTVRRMHQHVPLMPMIVLSGLEDETMAVAVLQEGAQVGSREDVVSQFVPQRIRGIDAAVGVAAPVSIVLTRRLCLCSANKGLR